LLDLINYLITQLIINFLYPWVYSSQELKAKKS